MAIRVLVADDSMTVRKRLCDVLRADPTLHVVGEAENGADAIELCQRLRPDIVTMDMMMPGTTGLEATEFIMAHCPTPILIVSSSTNRGELFKTYEALAAGAVDVLEKPLGHEPDGGWESTFVAAVKLVSRIRVVTHPRARLASLMRPRVNTPVAVAPYDRGQERVVAVGASTGGPGAILEILRALPLPFPYPILLVIHINEPFSKALADWLDTQTDLRVGYPRDGDSLSDRAGQVTMAPADAHMIVRGGRIHLSSDPPRHSCRPSVDVLFESVAKACGPAAIGVLLTGMGRDGAAGLLDIRRARGVTIAQDEATSVVYGMPREAVAIGAVERELPLSRIGAALAALALRDGATTA